MGQLAGLPWAGSAERLGLLLWGLSSQAAISTVVSGFHENEHRSREALEVLKHHFFPFLLVKTTCKAGLGKRVNRLYFLVGGTPKNAQKLKGSTKGVEVLWCPSQKPLASLGLKGQGTQECECREAGCGGWSIRGDAPAGTGAEMEELPGPPQGRSLLTPAPLTSQNQAAAKCEWKPEVREPGAVIVGG